jgi:hypothetical protein
MDERLEHIRTILARVPHVAIATVSEDGTPHNTPVFGVFNEKLHLFWASGPEAQHSHNIRRHGEAFVAVFDSVAGGGGLYVAGRADELDDPAHLDYAYALLSEVKARYGGSLGSRERFEGEGPQRFYRLIPSAVWLHRTIKDDDGLIITDERVAVPLAKVTE